MPIDSSMNVGTNHRVLIPFIGYILIMHDNGMCKHYTTGATFVHLDPSQQQGRGFAKGMTGRMAYDTMLAVV